MIRNYYWGSATYHHIFTSAEERDAALQFIVDEINFGHRRPKPILIGLEPAPGMFLIYCANRGDIPRWVITVLDRHLKISKNQDQVAAIGEALRQWTY